MTMTNEQIRETLSSRYKTVLTIGGDRKTMHRAMGLLNLLAGRTGLTTQEILEVI